MAALDASVLPQTLPGPQSTPQVSNDAWADWPELSNLRRASAPAIQNFHRRVCLTEVGQSFSIWTRVTDEAQYWEDTISHVIAHNPRWRDLTADLESLSAGYQHHLHQVAVHSTQSIARADKLEEAFHGQTGLPDRAPAEETSSVLHCCDRSKGHLQDSLQATSAPWWETAPAASQMGWAPWPSSITRRASQYRPTA